MLYRSDGTITSFQNLYLGRQAFLICGGPSLLSHDLTLLQKRGVLSMAVNNAASVVRPQLWTIVDDPGNFCDGIWQDPAILKFVPFDHFKKAIVVRDAEGNLVRSSQLVRDMPAVLGYKRNEDFVAERYLTEETFNWGNHCSRTDSMGIRGGRSVMYVALKLLYHLGCRCVYLVGCDFQMSFRNTNYAFEQARSHSSVKGNNQSYRALNVRLESLRPIFEQLGYYVYNCTPNSGLTVFPHVPFDQAISNVFVGQANRLNTAGMYDRQKRERDKQKKTERLAANVGNTEVQQQTLCVPANAPLKLEIVSHCWQYSRLLAFQLSSLVLNPPQNIRIRMTVFYSKCDVATRETLDFFTTKIVQNVEWRWWELETPQLFRRAIGRNLAALSTKADWIWFCDCDQHFSKGFLDSLARELRYAAGPLVYPQCVRIVTAEASQHLLEIIGDKPVVYDIPNCDTIVKRHNRATGGLQIVHGEAARRQGYCRDVPKFMAPATQWMRTFEDVSFRKILGTKGVPLQVDGLTTIEHSVKGRFDRSVSL